MRKFYVKNFLNDFLCCSETVPASDLTRVKDEGANKSEQTNENKKAAEHKGQGDGPAIETTSGNN